MADEDIAQKVGGFAADDGVDNFADTEINRIVDALASHVPGGSMIDGLLKTGVDLAANNAINAELGKLGGIFGQRPSEPPAQS